MSLAYPIEDIDDLIFSFAAKDEFISTLTCTLHLDLDLADNSSSEEYVMTPKDDYYVAPYCFIRTGGLYSRHVGFLVFSSMVPFVERKGHELARRWVRRDRRHQLPHIGTMEHFQQTAGVEENDIYTFTSDGCFPSAEDVSQELEDMAIRVVCDLLKWKFPMDWRQRRRQETLCRRAPVLDLAEYDRRHENHGQQQHQLKHQLQDHHQRQLEDSSRQQHQLQQEEHPHFYDAKQFATDEKHGANGDNNEEEKKETSALDYLPLPPLVHTPIREKSNNNNGYDLSESFFEKNADIFGSSKGSRYYYENHEVDDMYDDDNDDGNTFISSYNIANDEDDLYGT